ncbi:hypothetical protein SDC9_124323 [bioreactor metagenome]|uniref:Uncharacterized protein n=1 Tax=bioreactor metagenome TaxID=1076179 RepID=A0A645CK34_9ZZZZ
MPLERRIVRQHASLGDRVIGAPHRVKTDAQLANTRLGIAQKLEQRTLHVLVVQTVGG